MTSLLGAKRRAEEFSAAAEGRTPASDLKPELAELVGVVHALRAHEAPAPRPEFSAELNGHPELAVASGFIASNN